MNWMTFALVGLLAVGGCTSGSALLAIEELNSESTPAGTYRTEGFLSFLDDCPYCPPGAMCEPCPEGPGFSVLTAQVERTVEWSNDPADFVGGLGPEDLLLTVNLKNEDQLRAGKRYEVAVRVTDFYPYGGANRFAELLDYAAR